MWMAVSPARRSESTIRSMMSRNIAVLAACICVVAGPWVTAKAQKARELDYMNDKLRIPDSEKFDESTYIETGVGLTFGVDRRLSYYAGNYAEAATQFANAVKRYPYKSEIWVFLSRSYFWLVSRIRG